MIKVRDYIRSQRALALVLAMIVVGIGFGCGVKADDSEEKQPTVHEHALASTVGHTDQEHTALKPSESEEAVLYGCPMNCIPPTEKPGSCPVCGMDLVTLSTEKHQHAEPPSSQEDLENLFDSQPTSEKGVLYICPMNCISPTKKPGKCPVCGMDLVAVEAGKYQQVEGPSRLHLSREEIQAAGIQVAPVEEKFVTADIRLYGKIEYDPVEQYKVTAYAPGVIDNIYVQRAGQVVRKGDPLFDLHSAELFYLEEELFETLNTLPWDIDLRPGVYHSRKRVGRWSRLLIPPKNPGEDNTLSAEETEAFQQKMKQIHRKMRLLGLSEEDIDGLTVKGRPTGIATVTTPMTGVVLEQNAFRGTFVNTGDVVFTIANPRVLWARLDAHASDFPWIRLGQDAEFETDAYPGKTFTGKVLFLDPEFDPGNKVFKVGVLYHDEKGLLKPNMLVRCVINAKMAAGGRGAPELATQGMMGTAQVKRTNRAPLVIPDTAPLITGERAVVYVEVPGEAGTYVGREIVLGPRAKGYYIVYEGLHKGEKVVVNGNFKIDSALQILAQASMMSQRAGRLPVEHYDHVVTPPAPPAPPLIENKRSVRGAQYELFGRE